MCACYSVSACPYGHFVFACMVTFALFFKCMCVCVYLTYGEPWWFHPALASITADGVDKRNDRVRSPNRPDPATERSLSYCLQYSSCHCAILVFPSHLFCSALCVYSSPFHSSVIRLKRSWKVKIERRGSSSLHSAEQLDSDSDIDEVNC